MALPHLAPDTLSPDTLATDTKAPAMFGLLRGTSAGQSGAVVVGASIGERLAAFHRDMRDQPGLQGIVRVAVALYDPANGRLTMFVNSHDPADPVGRVSMRLAAIPALAAVALSGEPLVDNDICASEPASDAAAAPGPGQFITERLSAAGIKSRCAMPMYRGDELLGFIFYNARWNGYFTPTVLRSLRPYSQLLATVVATEVDRVRALTAVALSADRLPRQATADRHMGESAGHLTRVAEYVDLIVGDDGWNHGLNDETASYLRFYAPLHDIGKLAIPAAILCKPAKLSPSEWTVMQSHVTIGIEMVEAMQQDLGAAGVPHFDLLRNIVAFHHETLDGKGYPYGATADTIPLEGRIVAVADVFDALTSRRPYKEPWTNDAAFEFLEQRAGTAFDERCIAAFIRRRAQIQEIQERIGVIA